MRNQSSAGRNAAAARQRFELRRQKQRKFVSIGLMVLAGLILVGGIQAFVYYLYFTPRVNDLNARFDAFMQERTDMTVLTRAQDQFRASIEALKPEEAHARQVLEQFELMVKHFRSTPLQTADEVQTGLRKLAEEFRTAGTTDAKPLLIDAATGLVTLADTLAELRQIYTIEFDQLQSSLDNPPLYLWPVSNLLRERAGYLAAVTYNRAMYLSQIGETGTARVLLTGLYASTKEDRMKGLVYYGLGRLQWELFINANEPENYFQALKFIRQSMQADPQPEMPKQVLDFMLSLDQGDSAPRAGEGDPSNPSEGEAASVPETTPLF